MVTQIQRPPTLTSVVAESIQEAIYRGELKPGDALREIEFSESLQVARGTVREALRSLQEDGLVEIFPHRGAFVTTLTPDRVRDIYSLRANLESFAVQQIMETQGYSGDDLQTMESLLAQMYAMDGQNNIKENVNLDLDFHYSICKPYQNELYHNFLKTVLSMSRLCIISLNLNSQKLVDAISIFQDAWHHQEVFDSIREGEKNQAVRVVTNHIEESKEALITLLENRNPESA
ncbi:MAG: GntR family transcriptional regulator [Anaerolineales bacterium]|nr:GntR family transcriptional regulator [Anaerolineales bacterium]